MSLAVAVKPLPQWLCEGLISGKLPWHQAQSLTYTQFSKRYTLRDSEWIGLFQTIAAQNQTIICLKWDQLWLPDELTAQVTPEKSLYLLIKFSNVLGVTFSDGTLAADPIQGPAPRGSIQTTPPENTMPQTILSTELVNLEENQVLLVNHRQGQLITLVFTGEISFLVMDSDQQPLTL